MMNEVEIKCTRCGATVAHKCEADLKEAFIRLLTWIPACNGFADKDLDRQFLLSGTASGWIQEDVPPESPFKDPFFGSDTWAYVFFDKEEGRTFKALLNELMRAAGYDPHALRDEAWKIVLSAREEAARREAAVNRRREERAELKAQLTDENVPIRYRAMTLAALLLRYVSRHRFQDIGELRAYVKDKIRHEGVGGISPEGNKLAMRFLVTMIDEAKIIDWFPSDQTDILDDAG